MSHFFAYISRMKLIERWALMRNVRTENVQEHSLQVAIVAHALAVVKNKFYDGNLNVERVALLAVFHDASEVLTGDMPTPVKYFNPEIKQAYKAIEDEATTRLLSFLPQELMPDYQALLSVTDEDKAEWALVKAADTICAYIKCLEEAATGNREFNQAKLSIRQKINSMESPEVQYFMRHFVESFSLNLDEMHS